MKSTFRRAATLTGISVSIDGDTILVGATFDDAQTGGAYVFERDQGGAGNWGEVKKLTASDAAASSQFGVVSVDGDLVIVGARAAGTAGAAYIFGRDVGGAGNWGEVKKLTASDAVVGATFGDAVGLYGSRAIVGDAFTAAQFGAAYVFERDSGGLDNWGEVEKLVASDADSDDWFGFSVAMGEDAAVVGAYFDDDGGADVGAAFVYYDEAPASAGVHFMEYKAKESDKKATNGSLPKGCNVSFDDPLFDFADGQTTAESYDVSKAASLGLPADKNSEGGVDLAGTHLLGLKAKPSKRGALPVTGGKFPKGRKHAKRSGVEVTISNPTFHDSSGTNTVRLDTVKVTRVLVPANKDLVSAPATPADSTDHYKCYKVKAAKLPPYGTLQDAKGKVMKNLQVVVDDQFGDGAAHPTYGDARLLDLAGVAELCNPVTKTNVDTVEQDAKGNTRTKSCVVTPAAVAAPTTSLLCWKGKVASKSYVQPWDGVSKGTKLTPPSRASTPSSRSREGTPSISGTSSLRRTESTRPASWTSASLWRSPTPVALRRRAKALR